MNTRHKVLGIGGRIKAQPSEHLIDSAFTWELKHQMHLFDALGLVDIAHTLTAIELETIPQAEGAELIHWLLILQNRPDSFEASPSHGDIYTNREAWLAERSAATAWLGSGRARREAITTAFVVVMRYRALLLSETLINLGSVLINRAKVFQHAVMPDYTYLQAAQPSTFGHYLLGFVYPLIRDLERIEHLITKLNFSPMGCGSTNGSRLQQGREQLAGWLGFEGIIPHARDAMWQTDIPIEITAVLTACIINISRLAEDLQIFCSQEFALIELDDSHTRTSKIMPQKKNPFALTHIRGVANSIIGLSTTVNCMARTPTGQPDNRLTLYGELPSSIQHVKQAAVMITEVISHLQFDQKRGHDLLIKGWAMATDLAEFLVLQCQLDFRSAHHVVASLSGKKPDASIHDINAETIKQCCIELLGIKIELDDLQLKSALDPEQAIQARQEPGGTADSSMEAMLKECRKALNSYHLTTVSYIQSIERHTDNLISSAQALNND